METLTILTKALLDKGVDYEVTLKGSEVGVRLYDQMTQETIQSAVGESLEQALSLSVAQVVSRYPTGYTGLSKL